MTETSSKSTKETQTHQIDLKPKLPGFFAAYVLFSLPGVLTGFIWFIVSLFVLISVIVGSFASSSEIETPLEFRVVEENTSSEDIILIYDLQGQILTGDGSLEDFERLDAIYTELIRRDFEKIAANENIKNVVFRMNTPGGTVFASEVLGDLIGELQDDLGVERSVYFFDQIVASGGLWAAYKQPNYVVGSPYGDTGSIGVILSIPNISELADTIGYRETIIKSSENKDIGNVFRDLSEEERVFLQSQVDEKYNEFVSIVATGRDLEVDTVREFANGFVYTNPRAQELGLIDELGSVNSAIVKASEDAGISEYSIYEVRTEPNPFSGLLVGETLLEQAGLSSLVQKVTPSLELQTGVVYAIDPFRVSQQ